jgi:hypothetical protein
MGVVYKGFDPDIKREVAHQDDPPAVRGRAGRVAPRRASATKRRPRAG